MGKRRCNQPAWINPMLATLTREHFSDPKWIYEPKLDGIRCIAFRNGAEVDLYSRNRLRLNETFPELVTALLKQRVEYFIVDGEVVALEGEISRFSKLQRRMIEPVRVFYYVFDVLYLDCVNVTSRPLIERKKILRRSVSFRDPLRFTEHREAEGEAFFRDACKRGWEGIIAKRADSVYVHQRSADWLKFKCESQQEFVIVGYTDPMGQRAGIGALLVRN